MTYGMNIDPVCPISMTLLVPLTTHPQHHIRKCCHISVLNLIYNNVIYGGLCSNNNQ